MDDNTQPPAEEAAKPLLTEIPVRALRNEVTGQELTFNDPDHCAMFLDRVAAEPQNWQPVENVSEAAHPFTGEC